MSDSRPRPVPLVIRHVALSSTYTDSSPARPIGGIRKNADEAQDRDGDVHMEDGEVGPGEGPSSVPGLTLASSLPEMDMLLTPPSYLEHEELFGGRMARASEEGMKAGMVAERNIQSGSRLVCSPPEILHRVLCSGVDDLRSVARAAETCKELRSFIYENSDQALWRDIHLRLYDDPRQSGAFAQAREDVPWKKQVQDREALRRMFSQWSEDRYGDTAKTFDMICETLLDMYIDLPSIPEKNNNKELNERSMDDHETEDDNADTDASSVESKNIALLRTCLSSPLFEFMALRTSLKETTPILRPLPSRSGCPLRRTVREPVNPIFSRLHCLLPPTLHEEIPLHREYRGYMRETVYTAKNYQEANEWAPLKPDGTVDWRLVDALSTVMMANAKDVIAAGERSWLSAIEPLSYGLHAVMGWGYDRLERPLDMAPGDVWDWAGVEGKWCGSYAFLDYSDWIALNEPRIVLLRRSMADLDLSLYHEAVGDLLNMELILDRSEDKSKAKSTGRRNQEEDLSPVTTTLPTNPLLPPIHFHGASAQSNGNTTHPSAAPHSTVRGCVQLTADDPPQVRWTIVIRYGGEDRWKIEGVQAGGRGSKRGFFGVWTDAAKEEHSPNGPAWYWKV